MSSDNLTQIGFEKVVIGSKRYLQKGKCTFPDCMTSLSLQTSSVVWIARMPLKHNGKLGKAINVCWDY